MKKITVPLWAIALLLAGIFVKEVYYPPKVNNIIQQSTYSVPEPVISASDNVLKIRATFQVETMNMMQYWLGVTMPPDTQTVSGTGSGFVWKDSLVVTAYHVVHMSKEDLRSFKGLKGATSKLKRIIVYGIDGEKMPARILYVDSLNDIAILSLGCIFDLKGLELSAIKLKKFDFVWTVGYPEGNNGVVISPPQIFYFNHSLSDVDTSSSEGFLVKAGHEKIMRISAGQAICHGSSGGPVLDYNGRVLGIIVTGDEFGNMEYVVPVELIKRLFYKHQK